jgi:hypothetical protein
VGDVQVHDADASSEPGRSRDQKQPCPDDDGPDGSRDALTGRCETFGRDGCQPCVVRSPHDFAQALLYSSWRRHQKPVSLRPLGARSSHWYMPQRPSRPRE